jgi:hypothetical protein
MPIKTEADLALAEKIDLARTLMRYKYRREAMRDLNEIEDAIKKTHDAEVAKGEVSSIDLSQIGTNFLVKELPSGDTDSDSGDSDEK